MKKLLFLFLCISVSVFAANDVFYWSGSQWLACLIGTQSATTGNVGAGDDDLVSVSIPANTLSADGQSIRIFAAGSVASGQSGEVNFEFGATSFLLGAVTGVANWTAEIVVMRTGSATQKISVITHGFSPSPGITYTTAAADLTGSVTMKLTGESTIAPVNNDVTLTMFKALREP